MYVNRTINQKLFFPSDDEDDEEEDEEEEDLYQLLTCHKPPLRLSGLKE